MAEKDSMLNTANLYATKVSAAASACSEVQGKINTEINTISENWKSDSGDAMVSKLQSLASDIGIIVQQLYSASSIMKTEAQSIYDSWPEDTVEEGEENG